MVIKKKTTLFDEHSSMRFGYTDYKSERECRPTILDKDSIIRRDNIIIRSKQDIEEICTHCVDKEKCIQKLKDIKIALFANLNKNGMNPHGRKSWWASY